MVDLILASIDGDRFVCKFREKIRRRKVREWKRSEEKNKAKSGDSFSISQSQRCLPFFFSFSFSFFSFFSSRRGSFEFRPNAEIFHPGACPRIKRGSQRGRAPPVNYNDIMIRRCAKKYLWNLVQYGYKGTGVCIRLK